MAKLVRRKRLKISWALSHAGSTPVRGTKFKKILDYGRLQIRQLQSKTTVIKQNKTIKELKNKNKCLLEDINEATNLISELQANPDARKAIKISEKTYYFDNFPKDIQELLIESIQYYDKQY